MEWPLSPGRPSCLVGARSARSVGWAAISRFEGSTCVLHGLLVLGAELLHAELHAAEHAAAEEHAVASRPPLPL